MRMPTYVLLLLKLPSFTVTAMSCAIWHPILVFFTGTWDRNTQKPWPQTDRYLIFTAHSNAKIIIIRNRQTFSNHK